MLRFRRRRAGLPGRDDDGFTLIEVVMAFALLALVVLGITTSVSLGFSLVRKAKVDQISTSLANAEIEKVRRLRVVRGETSEAVNAGGYTDIGTVGGNPPGSFQPSRTETVRGIEFTIDMDVEYVSDPVPGGPVTQADYKLVTVSVHPTKTALGKTVTAKTFVAPETSASPATVVVHVLDAGGSGGTPAEGVAFRIHQNGFDSRTDASPDTGDVVFAGLQGVNGGTPYTVELADANWLGVEGPQQVSPNDLDSVEVTFHVYRTLTTTITVRDAATGQAITGNDYALAVSVDGNAVLSGNGRTFFGTAPPPGSLAGAVWTLSGFDGTNPFVAGMTYNVTVWGTGYVPQAQTVVLPPGYPGGALSASLAFDLVAASTGTLGATVMSGGSPVQKARVQVSQAGTDLVKYAVTDSAGQVNVTLPGGTYQVTASGVGTPQTQTLGVVQGTPTTATFNL